MVREITELMVSKEILGEYICNQERKNKAFQRISETRREKRSTGGSMNTGEIRQIAVLAKNI